MKKFLFLIIVICFFVELSFAQIFTEQELELIDQILREDRMDSSSVNFLKDWASDTHFKIPKIVEILNKPMDFPVFVQETETTIKSHQADQMLNYFSQVLYQTDLLNCSQKQNFRDFMEKEVKKPKHIFDYVQHVWAEAYPYYERAWEHVSPEERNQLLDFSLSIWKEEEDSLEYNAYYEKYRIAEYDSLTSEDFIPIIEKIYFKSLMQGAYIFQVGFDVFSEHISQKNFQYKKVIEKQTKWGNWAIGTLDNDQYSGSYSFIFDPDGHDVYRSTINANFAMPFYWVIDLAGDDHYANPEIAGLFRVFSGLGASLDIAGNDVYQTGDHGLSSFLGYQFMKDGEGDDIYSCKLHCLGATSFGISFLIDEAGNDKYNVTQLGQGFSGPYGAGLLIDWDGNDLYYSGGKYLHAPLAPLDHRSLSQGFSIGLRPDYAGGIGLLYDDSGNDYYDGGVYSQAVGYWYALGILVDNSGNDFYDAVYYPQGSGIHLAGGFLLDREGEDNYYSKHGPGQGAGHDYAIGFLVDRAGNDSYSVEGGNGLGITNSVGIFLDVWGDDRYENNFASNYGFARGARASGSIGIFLDTGGKDQYPAKLDSTGFNVAPYKDNAFWTQGTFAVGLDTLLVEPDQPVEEMAEEGAAEVDSLAPIGEIFDIASEWGVGSAAQRVEKASEILLKRDDEAAQYIYENELGTKSGLTYRAIKNYAKESIEFGEYIPIALHHADSLWVKNTIGLIGDLGDTTYIDSLQIFIQKEQYIPSVLSALGRMKSDSCTVILQDFIESDKEKWRVITARGLKAIGSEKSRALLMDMKEDKSFLIQSMIRLLEE